MATNQAERTQVVKNKPALVGASRMFARGGKKLSPANGFKYKGRTEVNSALGLTRGEPTEESIPSDDVSGDVHSFITQAGSLENDTGTFTQIAHPELNEYWLTAIRNNHKLSFFIPVGNSRIPSNMSEWDSALLVDNSSLTSYKMGDTFNPSENAGATMKATGEFSYPTADFHRIAKLAIAEVAGTPVVREVLDVAFRKVTGGEELFVLVAYNTGVAPAEVVGRNKYGVWGSAVSLAALTGNQQAEKMAVVGDQLVITSSALHGSISIAITSVLASTDASALQTSGYTNAKGPMAVFSRSAGEVVTVGIGGYIQIAEGASVAPVVKDAGSATTQNLLDIHGYGDQLVAVGVSNAVVVSEDFGETWTAKTGPNSGVQINAVFCLDEDVFLVGCADGDLYFTEDFGATWSQITHGTGITDIHDITFAEGSSVGFLVGTQSGAGYIARTLDSGNTWSKTAPYIASLPSNVDLNAVVALSPNHILIGGEGAASDGFVGFVNED